MIVSTDDGLITWYRVEQPLENQDLSVDNTMTMKILDHVDYEWDFFHNTSKVTGDSDDVLKFPAAYLKYSRSHQQILLGTQSGLLGKLAVAAEKLEDEEEDN